MLTIDKSQTWEELERRFARVVDGLGEHIDARIMDAVIALNANDVYTVASCEGHLDHGCPYPWIDVSLEEAESTARKIAVLLHDGKREAMGTQLLMQIHRSLLLQAEYELVGLLDAFYQCHPFNYDHHLSIWRFGNGKPRLQSHGAEYQQFREEAEKAEKLAEYQREMQCFASFLRERFFAGA